MRKYGPDWEFGDAWVLTAIAISPSPCSLNDMVEAADGLNHAILLDTEVDGALAKLLGTGLMQLVADREFELTPEGSALVARRRGGMFSQVGSVLSLLASIPASVQDYTHPAGALQEAVDAYLERARARRAKPR